MSEGVAPGLPSPLTDRVIATTRGDASDDPLANRLLVLGATVVSWETLTIEPTSDPDALRRAVAGVDEFDWIAFTSAAAVAGVLPHGRGIPTRARVASVGPGTSRSLAEAGWPVSVQGSGGARALVERWSGQYDLRGSRILFLAGSMARSTLEEELDFLGARVERVEAYRTRLAPPDPVRVHRDLGQGVDTVTFASPSAVHSLSTALADRWPTALGECGVAAIGPTTAEALVAGGLDPMRIVVADQPTIEGLVQAVIVAAAHTTDRKQERAS